MVGVKHDYNNHSNRSVTRIKSVKAIKVFVSRKP